MVLSVIDAYTEACGAAPLLIRNSVLRKGIALYTWSIGGKSEVHVPAADELVLLVHLSGSYRARLEADDNPSRKASKPGDITLIPRGQGFGLLAGEDMGFATLIIARDAPPPRDREPWFRLLGLSSCVFARHDDFVAANIQALIDAIKSPPRDGLQYFNQMFDSLIFHLARIVDDIGEQLSSGNVQDTAPSRVIPMNRLLDYIEENLAEKLSLEDLAKYAGVGRSLFAREFREQLDCAPHQYIVERRIERAKVLLKKGVPVTEVAFELGFSSQSHFSTTFKAITGCAPRAYVQVNL